MHTLSRPLLLLLLTATGACCSSCTGAASSQNTAHPEDPTSAGEDDNRDGTPSTGIGEGSNQSPLTFRITNGTGQPRYLSWDGTTELVECSQRPARSWSECHFRPPFCVAECTADAGAQSCPECARPPNQVRRLLPGDHVDLEWSGRLHVQTDQGRRCACYRALRPAAGTYRARLCSYPSASCSVDAECEDPDGDGILNDSGPTGEPTCVTVEFDVPRSESLLELPL